MEKQNQNFTILGDVKTNYEFFNWFNLLSAGDKNRETDLEILFNQTGNVLSTIMKFRKRLLQNNPIQILDMEDVEQFREQLEQMFLEPISISYARTILKVAKQNGWTAETITREHLKNPERRIWTIVCCKNQYIAR